MLRVLRATVARRSRTASFFARTSNTVALLDPPSQTSHFTFLRNLSSSQSSHGSPGPIQTEANNGILETQQLLGSRSPDFCESLKSAEEDTILAASEIEDDDDEDEGDMVAELGKDSDEESMSNLSDDTKEIVEEGFDVEDWPSDVEEEFWCSEETAELLTIDEVKQVLEEVRARDVQIFSVQDRCEWTDVMVVATGISDRHVRGIADALVYKIKKKGNIESPLYPTIEGQGGGKWLVVDCGNIVIHVLTEDSRAYYRLEDLWTGDVKPSTTDEDLEKMIRQAGLKDVVP